MSKIVNLTLFLTLTFLMTLNVVLINDTRKERNSEVDKYSSTTTVFLIEVIKLGLCLVFLFITCGTSPTKFMKSIEIEIFGKLTETLKCSIPALIYVVQNNLAYVALQYLDPGTFTVTAQIKLLTTAVFMRLLLGKVLRNVQWVSLVILLIGVSLAEVDQFASPTVRSNEKLLDIAISQLPNNRNTQIIIPPGTPIKYSLINGTESQSLDRLLLYSNTTGRDLSDVAKRETIQREGNWDYLKGLMAAVTMTFTSALAGVYMEKLLKASSSSQSQLSSSSPSSAPSLPSSPSLSPKETKNNADASTVQLSPVGSLWMRNIQMFIFSIPSSLIGCMAKDGLVIQEKGFTHGYTLNVWLIVLSGSLGGLATALMLKYLDNIYKNFASSFSILLAALCSMILYRKQYHELFFIGCTMVCLSLFMYHKNSETAATRAILTPSSQNQTKSFFRV